MHSRAAGGPTLTAMQQGGRHSRSGARPNLRRRWRTRGRSCFGVASRISCAWGFDYNFTNYNFRKTLDVVKIIYCQRSEIQCLFEIKGFVEIIVGESIVKSPFRS